MSKPLILKIGFILTTPAFLGDAQQKAALRPQSFKGALRFWYRAVVGDLCHFEDTATENFQGEDFLWGGTGDKFGQSRILLRVSAKDPIIPWNWQKSNYKKFGDNSKKIRTNGIQYLGYTLGMGTNKQRNALKPSYLFTLIAVIPRPHELTEHQIKATLASFWLFSVLGSCGTRSRRGFGSLQAYSWKLENADAHPDWIHLFNKLPNPYRMNAPTSWRQGLQSAMACFYGNSNEYTPWFNRFPNTTAHPHIPRGFTPKILQGFITWEEALNHGGAVMQAFRATRSNDTQRVLDLLDNPTQHGLPGPDRAIFGLPLTFQFKSKNLKNVSFYPQRAHTMDKLPERASSLLFLKIIRLGTRFYPLYFRLGGHQPNIDIKIRGTIQWDRSSINMKSPNTDVMEIFFNSLEETP